MRYFSLSSVAERFLTTKAAQSTPRVNLFAIWLGVMGVLLGCAIFPIQIASSAAGINEQVNFQGRLLNSSGVPVPDGNYNVQFKIYQDGDGVLGGGDEVLKWTETHLNNTSTAVQLSNGYMSVQLGAVNPFLSTVDWNQDTLWISVNIGTTTNCTPFSSCTPDGEMTPFKRLSANPYSLNSKQLGGLTSSQFVQLAQGLQADGSTTNASIAINKTGGSANILDLQRGGASVDLIDNNGTSTLQGTGNNSTLLVKQSATASPTADIFDILGANGTTKFISVVSTAANAGTVTIQSVGASNDLTIDSGSGVVILGANTVSLKKVGTALSLDLNNSSNSLLTVTNSGAGIASLSVEGAGTFNGTGKTAISLPDTTTTTGLTIGSDTNLYRSAADTLKTDDSLVVTNLLQGNAGLAVTGADINLNAGGTAASNFNAHINDSTSTGTISIGNSASTGFALENGAGTGANGVNLFNGSTAHTILFATGAAAQNVTVGSTNSTSATTLQAGSGNISLNASQAQFSEVTGIRTLTVQTRTSNIAGSNLTIIAGSAGSGASAFTGGTLNLQGGSAGGTGVAAGADVIIQGGTGVGGGAPGVVQIRAPVFSAASTQTFGSSGTITQSVVDGNSTVPVNATAASLTITLPAPTNTTVGRIIYITAVNGSNAYTLTPSGGTSFIMAANSTATFVWNGAAWTNAGVDGGSSSYIQNQTASAQLGNFSIQAASSAGNGTIGGAIRAASGGQTVNLFEIQNASGVMQTAFDSTGNLVTSNTSFNLLNTNATTINFGGVATTLNVGASGSSLKIQAGNALDIEAGSTNSISVGTSTNNKTINIGAIGSTNNSTTIHIADSTANTQTVTIGGTAGSSITTVQAGSGNINLNASQAQFSEVTGTRTLTVQTRTSNIAGSNLTISAGSAGSGGSPFTGGTLTLQGGAAGGTGVAAGADVIIQGGTGVGGGAPGVVQIRAPVFSAASTQTFGSSGTITQSVVDGNSTIPVNATAASLTITLPAPTNTTVGRIIYITAVNGSNSFTLAPSGGTSFIMAANSTATFVWNGAAWTNAGVDGGSSSYIQNQSASPQQGNFYVQSAAAGSIGGVIRAATSQTASLLEIRNSSNAVIAKFDQNGILAGATGSGTNSAGGDLTIGGGQGTGTAGGGNILLQVAKPGSTGSSVNNLATVFSLAGGASGNAGAAVFKNAVDSSSGFQIQNSGGINLFDLNSSTGDITTNRGVVSIGDVASPAAPTLTTSPSGGTLLATTTYAYRLAAVDANGNSTEAVLSNPASVTTANGPNNNSNTLTWSAVTGAASFNVYRTNNGGTNWFVNNVTSGTTSIVDNGSNFTWATAGTPTSYNQTAGLALQGNTGVTFSNVSGAGVTLEGPLTISTSYVLRLPSAQGGVNTVLINDGQGALSWSSASTCVTCVATVPTTSAQNTIAPTTNNVVSLTVKGTSSNATADVLDIYNAGSSQSLQAFFNAAGALTLNTGNTFTNAGGSLLTAIAITDKPTGGSIGAANVTVDVATSFNVTQTTSGQTLSLPNPSVNTAGRVAYVSNTTTNSTSFIMSSVTIGPSTTAIFMWNGTAWTTAGVDGASNNYIQNQSSADQTANFRITGTARANVSVLSPILDVATAGTLTIGTNTATAITLAKSGVISTFNGAVALSVLGSSTGANTVLCTNGSNQIASCATGTAGTGNFIVNGTNLQGANYFIQSTAAAGTPTAVIEKATSQTGDLLRFLDTNGSTVLAKVDVSGNISGATLSATGGDSVLKGAGSTSGTTAFEVQNSSGIASLFVRNDTRIGIGTSTPGTILDVNGTTTARGYLSTTIGAPATPTITDNNGAGACNSSWGYKVSAVTPSGETAVTAQANGNTNPNSNETITWNTVSGATSYNVYRTQVPTTVAIVCTTVAPNTTGLIGQVSATFTGATTYNFTDNQTAIINAGTGTTYDTSYSVGIGTNTPAYNLDVAGSNATDYVARIKNTNTANTADVLLLDMGVATGSRAAGNYYIGFAASGTVAGKIQGTGTASTIAYTTTGADYAEYFLAGDLSHKPTVGDIVSIDASNSRSVKKSSPGTSIAGVVSDSPGFIGNGPLCAVGNQNCDSDYQQTNVLVGLSGQLDSHVSTANGPILIGDGIAASSVTGHGAAIHAAGNTVGTALEGFDPNNGVGATVPCPAGTAAGVKCGSIKVYVHPGYFDPTSGDQVQGANANFGNLTASNASLSNLTVAGVTTTNDLNVKGSATLASVTVTDTANVQTLNVIGATTTKELSVVGTATIADLKVTNGIQVNGDVNLGSATDPVNPTNTTYNPGNVKNAVTKKFKASKAIAAGEVVIADAAHDGQVTTTTTGSDTRVLGVSVSAAAKAGDVVTIAISGTVQVETLNNSITSGDLLVSSTTEGMADKNATPAAGSLIGKALGKPDATSHLVWVLVSLN